MQREDPNIYLVVRDFLRKLLSKFVSLRAFKNDYGECIEVTEVDYNNSANHLPSSQITIGIITKQTLNKRIEDGDISNNSKVKFLEGVKAFYLDCANQALKKLPFHDPALNNSQFLNFDNKEECTFDYVVFFCEHYSEILSFTPLQMDKLQEKFTTYQLLQKSDIPEDVRKEAQISCDEDNEKVYYRMDKIWGYLSQGIRRFVKIFFASKCWKTSTQ